MGSRRSGRGRWEEEETSADLLPFVLFPLPAWNFDAMLEVEQPHCDHKVTMERKGPKESLSFNAVGELSLNKEKLLIWISR